VIADQLKFIWCGGHLVFRKRSVFLMLIAVAVAVAVAGAWAEGEGECPGRFNGRAARARDTVHFSHQAEAEEENSKKDQESLHFESSQMEVAPLHCTVDITQKRSLSKTTKEIENM